MKPVISTIKDIYPSSQAEAQKQRYKSAVTAFAEHFGSIGEHRFFSAREEPRYAETTPTTTTARYSQPA